MYITKALDVTTLLGCATAVTMEDGVIVMVPFVVMAGLCFGRIAVIAAAGFSDF